MEQGVTILKSESVFIDFDATIGMDTEIHPNSFINGKSQIGENCVIGPHARVTSSVIRDDVHIFDNTVLESTIGKNNQVGPHAYVRPNSQIGDADVDNYVNVWCGFVNYNGKEKHRSIIEDHAFIGCNSNLVAPVLVESSAYIAA